MNLFISTAYAEFLTQAMYIYSERFEVLMRPFIKFIP